MSNPGFVPVPETMPDERMHRMMLARGINNLLRGKFNGTLDVTLTASAASTTINDARIGYYSAVVPAMAMTSSAATSVGAGIYVDTLKTGSCVVHHDNTADTDKTIRFILIG